MLRAAAVALLCLAPATAATPPPERVRADFVAQLARPKVAPDPRALAPEPTADGIAWEHLSIASEKKRDGSIERVPMLIARPEKATGRLPVVIVLHGTGGNKEGQREWMTKLAYKQFLALAIDARYHGERAGGAKGADAYNAAVLRAWRAPAAEQEHPFFYDTVWDLWRTVDYLQSRPDVDGQRIGMIGFSMGGIQTWLAAAGDARIRVAVPAIAVQSFRYSLDSDRWQGRARTIWPAHEAAAKDLHHAEVDREVCRALWSKLIPGILDEFDGPSMLPLLAGRPLLVLSGEVDPNNPIEGARIALAATERAYRAAGASDRLKVMIAPGVAHAVTPEQHAAALAWFERWLGKPAR